jgi:hypothetical protein
MDYDEHMEKPKYITEKEVHHITRLALSTLRNHRHLGIGIPYIKIGRAVRYSLPDVIGFMESKKIQTAQNQIRI